MKMETINQVGKEPLSLDGIDIPLFSAETSWLEQDWMSSSITDLQKLEENRESTRVIMELFFMQFQKKLCTELERWEGKQVFQKETIRTGADGASVFCNLEGGDTLERGNVSIVTKEGKLSGDALNILKTQSPLKTDEPDFFAIHCSVVFHPRNPNLPHFHANIRYLEVIDSDSSVRSWFGGLADMTPFFVDKDDFKHFHSVWKQLCDNHSHDYMMFKKACDDYFYLPHHKEHRGIGGIYFDHMPFDKEGKALAFLYEFAQSCFESYFPIVKRNKDVRYTHEDRLWQLKRRSRYTEYNLAFDRGFRFGLVTPGVHLETLLSSLPPIVIWESNLKPNPGSNQELLVEVLRKPVNWHE